jgi:hypothetical protein
MYRVDTSAYDLMYRVDLREKGEGKRDRNFTLAHHRCHQWSCRDDRAWDRIGIGEPEQTMHLRASTRVTGT